MIPLLMPLDKQLVEVVARFKLGVYAWIMYREHASRCSCEDFLRRKWKHVEEALQILIGAVLKLGRISRSAERDEKGFGYGGARGKEDGEEERIAG